jgi:hypothetical protein
LLARTSRTGFDGDVGNAMIPYERRADHDHEAVRGASRKADFANELRRFHLTQNII